MNTKRTDSKSSASVRSAAAIHTSNTTSGYAGILTREARGNLHPRITVIQETSLHDQETARRLSQALPRVIEAMDEMGFSRDDQARLLNTSTRTMARWTSKPDEPQLDPDQLTRCGLILRCYLGLRQRFNTGWQRWLDIRFSSPPFMGHTIRESMVMSIQDLMETTAAIEAMHYEEFPTQVDQRDITPEAPVISPELINLLQGK